MNIIYRSILLFYLFLPLFSVAQSSFPENWLGSYKGELFIFAVDSVKMKLQMELKIDRTQLDSIYDWQMTYDHKGKRDIRPYSLVVVNPEKGHYKIDERNSIVIDSYLFNDSILISYFMVEESVIIVSYEKQDDNLIFELISSKSVAVSITGDQIVHEEKISKVETYPVVGRQRAVLIKQ